MPTDLTWPNCLNVRDLGGLPTTHGGEIRSGALIRSDSHGKLTDEGIAAVTAHGVSRIIDLRRETECVAEPSPFAGQLLYLSTPRRATPSAPPTRPRSRPSPYTPPCPARPRPTRPTACP